MGAFCDRLSEAIQGVSTTCILMGRCGKLSRIIIKFSLLSGVLAMFYVFDNILILFKSMASCDALPTSICYECRDLDYVVKHDYTTIFSVLTL